MTLPPIEWSSKPHARVMAMSRPALEWRPATGTDGGWALRVAHAHDTSAMSDPRWPDVVELGCENATLLTSPALTRLRRATVDGRALSALASRSTPCPLEVAFPRVVGNWVDGMIQIHPPLTRGLWRDALAIGALERLRALSFDARESPKERLSRGVRPYAVGPEWFWSSPLARRLEALSISAELHPLVTWSARFAASPKLARVHLLVWCGQKTMPWSRPLRIVIDREGAALRLTLQCAVSLLELLPADLDALFAGMTGEHLATLDVETLDAPLVDETAVAELVRPYGPVGALRGDARLIEL